ncbi:MAG TPA: AAA family ATPase [Candidatus Dormibacteraeota bacterium]|nr:AAA family ATPase [Candidatus Dormibacteraeota bacterium]
MDDGHRGVASLFVGRREELAVLGVSLEEARSGTPRVVLIEGPPGMGKTALIRRFLCDVAGLRVLRADCDQAEQLLPYGTAEQLARSAGLPPLAPPVPDEREPAVIPEPFTVGARLVDLVGGLQEQGPVALVVDDAQWADRPSLLALLFALRRFQADRVLTLIAVREEDVLKLPEGLLKLIAGERGAEVRLGGLDAADVEELARGIVDRGLSRGLAEELRDHSGGNPLHVRALLEELPLERLGTGGDTPLPSPRSFAIQVLRRMADCSADSRRLLSAASVLGVQCPLTLAARLAGVGGVPQALEQPIAARLLELREFDGDHSISFAHALTRSAIYHDMALGERAALHLRAAELVADEGAALFHRCAATFGEDETLAEDLAGYAHRNAARGATSRAAAAMLRASRMSSTVADRERRLLEAVEFLLAAGDVARAATYIEQVRNCADGPYPRYLLGRLAFHAGRRAEGERLLLAAWEARDAGGSRELSSRIATEMALLLVRRSRGSELVTWARRALAAAAGTARAHSAWHTLGYGLGYAGRAGEGLSELAFLPEYPSELRLEDVEPIYARGLLKYMTDDLEGARADFTVLIPAAEQSGAFDLRFGSICFLGAVEYRLGAWDDAIAHATLATSLCEDADEVWTLSWTHTIAAAPLAGRGEWALAEAHADATQRYAQQINDENSIADAAITRAHIAAVRADHAAVIDALLPIRSMEGREGIDEPGARWPWQELLADALIGVGRSDEAEDVLAPFEAIASARQRRSSMANAARVRGNLEAARRHPAAADAAFLAGLDHTRAVSIPFDRARLMAAYGRFLRRNSKRAAAATQLKAARELFAALDARPYIEMCTHELALVGVVPTGRDDTARAGLTPQEVAVARLVMRGLSNREVAAHLVVSVNTVEFHLKNIYSKLGITSRSQLGARYAGALSGRAAEDADA